MKVVNERHLNSLSVLVVPKGTDGYGCLGLLAMENIAGNQSTGAGPASTGSAAAQWTAAAAAPPAVELSRMAPPEPSKKPPGQHRAQAVRQHRLSDGLPTYSSP